MHSSNASCSIGKQVLELERIAWAEADRDLTWHGDVDGVALPFAGAHLGQQARPGPNSILMHVNHQHTVIIIE